MGDGDNAYRKFKGFKWTTGDEDVPSLALVVDQTSRQLHITEPSDVKTDWNVSADTHPSVYIHSATTPATYYMKLYHDGTYGYLNVAGTTVLTATASALATTLPLTTTATTGISFNPTLVPDATRTNYIWSYGTRATAKSLSMAASANYNLDPVQMNLSIIGTAPTSSTINLSYMLITHSFANMAALRLKCSDWNIVIAKNILDAYVYQGEVDITASSAIGSEVVGLGLTMNVSAGTVTGLVRGIVVAMYGASMPATTSYGLNINTGSGATLTHAIYFMTQSGTTITNGVYVNNVTTGTFTNLLSVSGTVVNFLNLASAGNSGFVTTGGTDCTASGTTDPAYTLKIINPAGGAGYIRVWAAA